MIEQMEKITQKIKENIIFVEKLKQEIGKVIVGQKEMIDSLLIALLTEGHILLEGMPGLAKTLTIKSFARAVDLDFQRVQFTPDLLPADLTGTLIFNPKEGEFSTRKGPLFTNIVLADEINRAPAKVQSALLQAMEEREVTIGETSFTLPEPFLVLATENPIDQEGTYPLPEAQADRFLMKVFVGYPQKTEEQEIVFRDILKENQNKQIMKRVISKDQIKILRDVYHQIYVDEKIVEYAVSLTEATRPHLKNKDRLFGFHKWIEHGASPRASIALVRAGRAVAMLSQRAFVKPEDIRLVAKRILRHRLILTYEAEAQGILVDEILQQVLDKIEVP